MGITTCSLLTDRIKPALVTALVAAGVARPPDQQLLVISDNMLTLLFMQLQKGAREQSVVPSTNDKGMSSSKLTRKKRKRKYRMGAR